MNCARMNSIYIKYTYIALYLGRGAVSYFSFLILKMKCCCLCLWFNHPAPSWLNFASSGVTEGLSWVGRRPGMELPPERGGESPRLPAPSQRLQVWVLVLLFWIRLFLGRGRGVCADYSRLVRLVLLLFSVVSMPGRGSEKPLLPPK